MLFLDRQLLARDDVRSPVEVTERLAGLNAQTKRGPVVAMWTRTAEYDHGACLAALRRYELVRANLMRGTVHLVTRRQFFAWRACLQPVAERAVRQYCPGLWDAADHDEVLAAGRALLLAEPGLTRAEIAARLAPRFPAALPRNLGFAVRMLLPVVEAADTDPWTSRRTAYVLAESVVGGQSAAPADGAADLAAAFLGAFGPATAADFGYWSGLSGSAAAVEQVAGKVTGAGRARLFDAAEPVPEVAPRPAVVLPEFDNVLFCRRNEPDLAAAKRRLLRPPAMMPGFVLAAGRVVAEWSAPNGNLVRLDWHNPSPAVLSEWEQFAAWYRAMPLR